jgi:hypothetical protein
MERWRLIWGLYSWNLCTQNTLKREEQSLEAAQIKFLRHLIGITKLDKEKNQCIREKNGSTEHSQGNKAVLEKVATTCTENGHK